LESENNDISNLFDTSYADVVLIINAYDNIRTAIIFPIVDTNKKLLNGVIKNKIIITIATLMHIDEFFVELR
jgi:hypothetical protein